MMKTFISTSLCIILLSGCGAEIAYKRGATGQDLQSEKKACKAAKNETELNQCLEDNGWAIQKLDGSNFTDDELFATTSVADDNRMTTQKSEKVSAIKTTESLKMQDTTTNVVKEKTEHKSAPTNQAAKLKTPSAKPQPSIFDTYVIKSWWKMGGGAALLEQNMLECNEQLGEAHAPNKKTFTFTRGFAICMRQKGWRGLIEK